jgi:DnaJ-class molecular chaperone
VKRTDRPPQQPTPRTCTGCNGDGGRTVDTSSNGIVRQNWKTCDTCNGSGTAGTR